VSRDLAAIDELLQIMFWLRSEGLLPDVAAADLVQLVGQSATEIEPLLQEVVVLGYARATRRSRYTLTDEGIREGARRFADEFAEMTKPGHGECGDPECDCHRTGSPADCVHRS
jgi:DNA-binding IclR family transcriptional regulator